MFSEWYLNRRYARGFAKGFAEVLAEARAEGSARERQRWESWNRARMAASEKGKKFTEPPPPAVDDRQPEDLT